LRNFVCATFFTERISGIKLHLPVLPLSVFICGEPEENPRGPKHVAVINTKTWLCWRLQFICLSYDHTTWCAPSR